MDNEWVFCLGGPKDGQILLGDQDADGLLMVDLVGVVAASAPRFAYYRVSGASTATDKGPIPLANYIGDQPPAQQFP